MGKISFIHLSDIHFRKTSGNSSDIDDDLRQAVLTDIQYNAKENLENIRGVLLSGDIAFAGQEKEYEIARGFLKNLTSNLNIDENEVFCVPGNHDVDQNVPRSSISVYAAQKSIETAETLDNADWILEKQMLDTACPDLLFKTIEQYNNFAVSYSCNLNYEKPTWTECFDLDHNMKLKLLGMNSCIISSQDDHKNKDIIRQMIIGQSQIPAYEDDTVWVSLCHHPVEFWKFKDSIQNKLDKRIDIQLYGHKHEQIVSKNNDRLVITAGAAQPTRGIDWTPRYNWISFECIKIGNDRHIVVKVYPRILSTDRDRFECDLDDCDSNKFYFRYELNIDQKRRKNLRDIDVKEQSSEKKVLESQSKASKNMKRELVYWFFELSFVQQSQVLSSLDLLRDEYDGKRYIDVIESILKDAQDKKCLDEFYSKVKDKHM